MEFASDSITTTSDIPVFYPTENEFLDFKTYITSIEKHGYISGICKIIPPKSWLEKLPDYLGILEKEVVDSVSERRINQISIKNPIEQQFSGANGSYSLWNLNSNKTFSVKEFYKTALKLEPAKPDYDRYQSLYWSSLLLSSTFYGADLSGSLFPSNINQWNISKLPNLLQDLPEKLPGVNTPYLYFGMWKATFGWHVEDLDLFSINFLHFGKSKQWYCIPPKHKEKFEKIAQNEFKDEFKKCDQFLRHKSCVFSPEFLQKNGIQVSRMIQHEGEIMITFPYAYHSGFNYGFNCAESTNFALESWLEIGRVAKHCKCSEDTVVMNIESLFPTQLKKRTMNEEYGRVCTLCRQDSDSILLETDDARWAHEDCASLTPGLKVLNAMIFGMASLPKNYQSCSFCSRSKGFPVKCGDENCLKYYHVTCYRKKTDQEFSGFCEDHLQEK